MIISAVSSSDWDAAVPTGTTIRTGKTISANQTDSTGSIFVTKRKVELVRQSHHQQWNQYLYNAGIPLAIANWCVYWSDTAAAVLWQYKVRIKPRAPKKQFSRSGFNHSPIPMAMYGYFNFGYILDAIT